MTSEYQSDATFTEFDHEIGIRSNPNAKPLKNLNSNTSGSEGNSILNLGANHQTSENFPKPSDLMLKYQKRQPWL